jgi:hypothetical protein
VVDVAVVDAAVLRAEALRILDEAITISEGALDDDDDDDDLLSPEEEITESVAAAVQWCVEPTEGLWPLVEAGAVRIDAIELRAEELGPSQVRVSWTVTVKISDVEAVRALARAACPDTEQVARAEIDAGFAAAWHWAADPCAPVADIPGATWTCVEVTVEQVLARTR